MSIDSTRITLSCIKHSVAMSRETFCFSAKVSIDGVPVGIVENSGRGESTRFYLFAAGAAFNRGNAKLAECGIQRGDDKFIDAIDGVFSAIVTAKEIASAQKYVLNRARRAGSNYAMVFMVGNDVSARHWRFNGTLEALKERLVANGLDISGTFHTL